MEERDTTNLQPQIDESEYKMPESHIASEKSTKTVRWPVIVAIIFLLTLLTALSLYIYWGMSHTPATTEPESVSVNEEIESEPEGESLETKRIRLESMMINDNSNPTDEQIKRLKDLNPEAKEPTEEQKQRLEQMNPGTFKKT